MNSLIVMMGGALGALARYHLGRMALSTLGSAFPWGTLIANISGGLAMGVLVGWLSRFATGGGEQLRLLLAVGVLGGFTTFSAFSLETVLMIHRGQYLVASGYVAVSVIGALAALMLGLSVMRGIA
ncbi:MAG: fluoride efflux transporter CrcB [Sphingobium sp.]